MGDISFFINLMRPGENCADLLGKRWSAEIDQIFPLVGISLKFSGWHAVPWVQIDWAENNCYFSSSYGPSEVCATSGGKQPQLMHQLVMKILIEPYRLHGWLWCICRECFIHFASQLNKANDDFETWRNKNKQKINYQNMENIQDLETYG